MTKLTDAEKLGLIEAWLHPGLWSAIDARREAFTRILAGESVLPPEWATSPKPIPSPAPESSETAPADLTEDDWVDLIRQWPNHPWLVLPGPTDLAPFLARYIVQRLKGAPDGL